MFLHALATAVPQNSLSQPECWDLIERSPVRQRLSKRSRLILHSVLRGDHGIDRRHFAVRQLDRIFDLTADELNAAFRVEAPHLAEQALLGAMRHANIDAGEIDALLICTCSGYLCPGVTSYVAEDLGLRSDAYLQDLVGLGCGAAIPSLRSASYILAARPDAVVACVAVEVCSAAFYLDDDFGVLISACLFGDGAAATVWRGNPGPSGLRAFNFDTLHQPTDRDKLRFEMKEGKLRNLLDRTVPELAAGAVSKLWGQKGSRTVRRVVSHAGGVDVLSALAGAVPGHSLAASATVLRSNGNLSSPSVLFALEETLKTATPDTDGDFWLVSFGAGFSAHSCRLGVGES
jgi:predicted naringenin-chalcone synthase